MQSSYRYVSLICALAFFAAQVTPARVHSAETVLQSHSVCDSVSILAANATGVPISILKAVGRTESGITVNGAFVPWPWTVNVEGRGMRLSSRQDARAIIKKMRDSGKTNIDIGCFQINHRWHGAKFSSIDEMLDPASNAQYAARFLKQLYAEYGDWVKAAGAYHSRNGDFSRKYLAKLIPILEGIDDSDSKIRTYAEQKPSPNSFPLLKGSSQSTARGSLFPMTTESKGSFFRKAETRG